MSSSISCSFRREFRALKTATEVSWIACILFEKCQEPALECWVAKGGMSRAESQKSQRSQQKLSRACSIIKNRQGVSVLQVVNE